MSAEELAWHREQASNIQDKFLVLEREIDYHCAREKHETKEARQKVVRKELISLRKRLTSINDSHCKFLKKLLDIFASENWVDSVSTDSSWGNLSSVVEMAIQSAVKSLKHAKEEITYCKTVMERQNTLLEDAAQMHEEAVTKLALEEEGREQQWEQRLTEIRRNYESILTERDSGNVDLQDQIKHGVCELEKLKRTNSRLQQSNSSLNLQLDQLKDVHKLYRSDRACLLSCVCLVTGSLFASTNRIQQLCYQKQLIVQLTSGKDFRHHTEPLPKSEHSHENRQDGPHVSHFKVVAIAVLAANRLMRLTNESLRLYKSTGLGNDGHFDSMFPYVGLKANTHRTQSKHQFSDRDTARWLRSEQVLLSARKCFSGLQTTLDSYTMEQPHETVTATGTEVEDIKDHLKTSVLLCHCNFLNSMKIHFL